jgi:hypothetical protein
MAIRLYPEDLRIVVVSFVVFFVLRAILMKWFYIPLANYLQVNNTIRSEGKSTKYQKFIENAWYSTFYPISTCVLYYILSQQIWWTQPELMFINRPHFDEIQSLRYFYGIQTGYYLQLLINLIFIDEKLDDFWEMFLHHVITLILIVFSYCVLYHRLGSMILLIHDFVDIFLYVAKAFHDAGFQTVANVLFIGFVIALPVVRLWYFGLHLIMPVFQLVDYPKAFFYDVPGAHGFIVNGLCYNGHCFSVWLLCVYAACTLWCLHLYWFYRTLLVLYRTIQNNGNVPGDPRYIDEKAKDKKTK